MSQENYQQQQHYKNLENKSQIIFLLLFVIFLILFTLSVVLGGILISELSIQNIKIGDVKGDMLTISGLSEALYKIQENPDFSGGPFTFNLLQGTTSYTITRDTATVTLVQILSEAEDVIKKSTTKIIFNANKGIEKIEFGY